LITSAGPIKSTPRFQGHPSKARRFCAKRVTREIVRAILSQRITAISLASALEQHALACDELAGFSLLAPTSPVEKHSRGLEVDSVKRRMKDKLFAKGVSRDDVRKGAEELGIPLEEHITFCIGACANKRTHSASRHYYSGSG